MTTEEQREFREMLIQDADADRWEQRKEHNLKTDYAEFEIYFADELQQFTEALEDIKKLYKQYNHEFDCKEF